MSEFLILLVHIQFRMLTCSVSAAVGVFSAILEDKSRQLQSDCHCDLDKKRSLRMEIQYRDQMANSKMYGVSNDVSAISPLRDC
jgi:hypothetical protein